MVVGGCMDHGCIKGGVRLFLQVAQEEVGEEHQDEQVS